MDQKKKIRVKNIHFEVADPESAVRWFCENLWFELNACCGTEYEISNGNCRLLITTRYRKKKKYPYNTNFAGYEHIALETADIQKALEYCHTKGMKLETNGGKAFYNPRIWGTGMNYFNIITEFGIKVEISQRLDRNAPASSDRLIGGLEHLGIEVSDLQESVSYYLRNGARRGSDIVENFTENGPVRCTMLQLDDIMIELYQFIEKTDYQNNDNNCICGLVLQNKAVISPYQQTGPDGERVLFCSA